MKPSSQALALQLGEEQLNLIDIAWLKLRPSPRKDALDPAD